jgi:mRNA-degrading endonuclease RelE of RelBE toxin-antitoxin system
LSYQVKIGGHVTAFYEKLAPAERRAVKQALICLREEKGDISALRENFEGCYRLRVGTYRIIFRYPENRTMQCLYMNARSVVYELFESELPRILTQRTRKSE